jgi:hypothetical protein
MEGKTVEFLQANWLWILLGLGVVLFFFRRGGMGCGMGEHGSHGGASSETPASGPAHGSRNGHGDGKSPEREAETAAPRSRRGCC